MKVFLSYPMNGFWPERVEDFKHELMDIFCNRDDVEFVDNSDCVGSDDDGRLYYLGEAIKKMDKCDAVAFHQNWTRAKGCIVERKVAETYGLKIIDQADEIERMRNMMFELRGVDPTVYDSNITRAFNRLCGAGVLSIAKLCSLTPEELRKIRGIGKNSVELIMDVVEKIRERYPDLA